MKTTSGGAGAVGTSDGQVQQRRAGLVGLGPLVGRLGSRDLRLLLLPRILDLELGSGWVVGG